MSHYGEEVMLAMVSLQAFKEAIIIVASMGRDL